MNHKLLAASDAWVRAARLALTPVAIMEGMAFAATVFGNKPSKPIYELARILLHHLRHRPRAA